MSAPRCPSEEELKAFQLGNLPDATLRDVAEHLEGCSHCDTLARPQDSNRDPFPATLQYPSSGALAEEATWATGLPKHTAQRPETAPASDASPLPGPAKQPDEVGRLGPYRLRRLLSQGGMGLVFEAEDLTLHRPVAVKVMKQQLRPESEGWQRFLREARILASIKHDNLVTVYQAGQEGSAIYLAMELLQGESLDERFRRGGPLALDELLQVAEELTAGLAAIHGHGLIHRDLKPANIWLEAPTGRVKILDFGLARFVDDDTNLTQTGAIMGTPAYMSPEQAQGRKADARSDLFSLGCVLYCLATGVKPFDAPDTLAILSALALRQPQPVHELNPAIPKPLSRLIMQLLAKDAADRPASAEEVALRLRELRSPLAEPSATLRSSAPRPTSTRVRGKRSPAPVRRPRWAGRTGKIALAVLVAGLLAAGTWMTLSALFGHPKKHSPQSMGEERPASAVVPEVVFLSSLPAVEAMNWPFRGPIPRPPLPPESVDQPPPGLPRVSVNGRASPHGLFMHLPAERPQKVEVSYRLDKKFRTFNTSVSLNDGPPGCTPMIFAVYGDGKFLWRSKPVASQADTQSCMNLSVQGVDKLTLQVSGLGDERGTHAVWIEPSVTSSK